MVLDGSYGEVGLQLGDAGLSVRLSVVSRCFVAGDTNMTGMLGCTCSRSGCTTVMLVGRLWKKIEVSRYLDAMRPDILPGLCGEYAA